MVRVRDRFDDHGAELFRLGFSFCKERGCVLASLGLFIFSLGLGIGEDYPMSTVIMSELVNKIT